MKRIHPARPLFALVFLAVLVALLIGSSAAACTSSASTTQTSLSRTIYISVASTTGTSGAQIFPDGSPSRYGPSCSGGNCTWSVAWTKTGTYAVPAYAGSDPCTPLQIKVGEAPAPTPEPTPLPSIAPTLAATASLTPEPTTPQASPAASLLPTTTATPITTATPPFTPTPAPQPTITAQPTPSLTPLPMPSPGATDPTRIATGSFEAKSFTLASGNNILRADVTTNAEQETLLTLKPETRATAAAPQAFAPAEDKLLIPLVTEGTQNGEIVASLKPIRETPTTRSVVVENAKLNLNAVRAPIEGRLDSTLYSVSADLAGLPSGSITVRAIALEQNPGLALGIRVAALQHNVAIEDFSAISVEETGNLPKALKKTSIVTIASAAWVESHGGNQNIRFLHLKNDGSSELLTPTNITNAGSDYRLFETQTDSLSLFALVSLQQPALTPTPAPASQTAAGSPAASSLPEPTPIVLAKSSADYSLFALFAALLLLGLVVNAFLQTAKVK